MRVRRVDANQPEVVKFLRSKGWFVTFLHTLGKGVPDLMVSRRMHGVPFCCLVEIKDGAKPPSKQKLTKDETSFAEAYTGPLVVALSGEDAELKLWSEWRAYRQMIVLGNT